MKKIDPIDFLRCTFDRRWIRVIAAHISRIPDDNAGERRATHSRRSSTDGWARDLRGVSGFDESEFRRLAAGKR